MIEFVQNREAKCAELGSDLRLVLQVGSDGTFRGPHFSIFDSRELHLIIFELAGTSLFVFEPVGHLILQFMSALQPPKLPLLTHTPL